MQLHHNIFKIYLLKGFVWFMVAMPIIVLFFQEHGLSLMQVMILQSVYSLTVAITEIPSGYFADFFGRKNFGTIMGISMTINAIVGIAGPVFVGWMFDINQNYQTPYLILSTSLLCAIPLTLNLKAK